MRMIISSVKQVSHATLLRGHSKKTSHKYNVLKFESANLSNKLEKFKKIVTSSNLLATSK